MIAKTPGPVEGEPADPLNSARGRPKGPLTEAELEEFRRLLLEKRQAILGGMDGRIAEARGVPACQGDQCPSPATALEAHRAEEGDGREAPLGLMQNERMLLREIADALDRIDRGTYGVCLGTGRPIGRARLGAKPWARYSVEYARRLEKRRRRGRGSARSRAGRHPQEADAPYVDEEYQSDDFAEAQEHPEPPPDVEPEDR